MNTCVDCIYPCDPWLIAGCRPSLRGAPAIRPLNLRQLPSTAAFAVEPLVGFLVVDEVPFLWIPVQFAAVPVGEIAEVADRHRAGADFHVAQRPFARADAVEPVTLVAGRSEELLVPAAEPPLFPPRSLRFHLAAV